MELQPCCNFNAISCWLCADPKISKFFFPQEYYILLSEKNNSGLSIFKIFSIYLFIGDGK